METFTGVLQRDVQASFLSIILVDVSTEEG